MSGEDVRRMDRVAESGKPEVVAAALRESIAKGDYAPGERLPSQGTLAARFRTSRPTVQLALKQLESDGLILPMQRGRRAEVADAAKADPPPLGPAGRHAGPAVHELQHAVERAFGEPQVTIDFWGFTAETLWAAMQQPLIRIQQDVLTPESVHLRLMLPSEGAHLALPRSVDEPGDPRPQDRLRAIRQRHSRALRTTFSELDARRGGSYRLEIREVPMTPQFKLCILNGDLVLSGLYRISEWNMPYPDGATSRTYDVEGFKVPMMVYQAGRDDLFDVYRSWFANFWDTIAEEPGPSRESLD